MKTSALIAVLAILGVGMAASDGNAAEVKPPVKQQQSKPTESMQPMSKQGESKPGAAEPAKEPAITSRVDLDATQITGNRELPRVLYVVPWKRADLGEMSGKPAKSLLDEVLAPVDRDVFRRQNRYHDALQTEAAASVADAPKGER